MDKEQCVKLIESYASYRPLWDPKEPNYNNKSFKEDTWKNISDDMNIPVGDLKKKMESLLGSYRREKSRERHSLCINSGRDEVYTSKWYAYEHFKFMADKNNPVETQDALQNIKVEVLLCKSETDLEGNEQQPETDNEEPAQIEQPLQYGHAKRKRKGSDNQVQDDERDKETFTFVKRCTTCSNDPYNTYGQYIANELRKYDPITLAHVKNAINNIIFEADTGKFQQYM